MGDAINDGGPVHPIPEVRGPDGCGLVEGWHGMSLRDWFAGQALAGICASKLIVDHAGTNTTDAEFVAGVARRSFMFADAMLKASTEGAQGGGNG